MTTPVAKTSPRSTGQKWVYRFGGGKADGTAAMKELLGGKGANLAEMSSLGLPVPPGFTITTEVCTAYYANGRTLPDSLDAEVQSALAEVGKSVGARFGDLPRGLGSRLSQWRSRRAFNRWLDLDVGDDRRRRLRRILRAHQPGERHDARRPGPNGLRLSGPWRLQGFRAVSPISPKSTYPNSMPAEA